MSDATSRDDDPRTVPDPDGTAASALPRDSPATDAAVPPAPPGEPEAPAQPRLHWFWTLASAAVLVLIVWTVVQPVSPASRLNALDSPERSLAVLVGRAMDLREGIARVGRWERAMHRAVGLEGADDVGQAIGWYAELGRYSLRPSVHMHRAVLEAEAGQVDRLAELVVELERRPDPFPSMAQLIAATYLDPSQPAGVEPAANWFEGEWFRDRFEIAVARETGHVAAERAATERLVARSDALLRRARAMVGALLVVFVAGGIAIVIAVVRIVRTSTSFVIGTAPMPPPWSGRLGAAVLLRGGAIAAVATVPLLIVPAGQDEGVLGAFNVLIGVVMAAPILFLARRHLFRPVNLGAGDALGLRLVPDASSRLWLAIPAVIVLGLAGDWAVGLAMEFVRTPGHWTEWFDEDLVFGGPAPFLATLAGAVIVAPTTEELMFRGVLFATLRRRLSWPIAATVSGIAFAVLHGYGIAGFASVWWSGVVWAWAYERTRSLWPAIVAHAFGNLWASAVVTVLLRS